MIAGFLFLISCVLVDCHAFICKKTSDALHLVNATQTAHAALKKGFGTGGVQKFFIDQSNSIKVNTATAGQRIERYLLLSIAMYKIKMLKQAQSGQNTNVKTSAVWSSRV